MGTPCASPFSSPETSPVLTRKKASASCETVEKVKEQKNQRIDSINADIKKAIKPILTQACTESISTGVPLACSSLQKRKALKLPSYLIPLVGCAATASTEACEKSAEHVISPLIDCTYDTSADSLKKATDKVIDVCNKKY
ncbi:MAG: hypothetical protein ACSNEK_09695 [Parachlamydiaceae bacterium]